MYLLPLLVDEMWFEDNPNTSSIFSPLWSTNFDFKNTSCTITTRESRNIIFFIKYFMCYENEPV